MMPRDVDAVKDARIGRATWRRVWGFAKPYRGTIAVFLSFILVAALLALVPPLVVREILDHAIPDANRGQIWWLAGIAVAAALTDAVLQIGQRWCSARVGEGLIADLRRALFAKVQRLPVAFFTRTPTGAITSRLNSDVVGAQSAVTSTLGSVVSNVIVLITTLATMLVLEWRLTLMALIVLPMFIIPAKRVGRRLQDISREQMQHNAAMSTQMTERFNVSGAVLVKLFGSLDRENEMFGRRANAVRDMPASARRCSAGCSSWRSVSSPRSAQQRSTASAPSSWSAVTSPTARWSRSPRSSPVCTSPSPG
jgi:ATP-binding cassette subfamily B protein